MEERLEPSPERDAEGRRGWRTRGGTILRLFCPDAEGQGRAGEPEDVDRLRTQLALAIEYEHYEEAARLKERIRQLGGDGAANDEDHGDAWEGPEAV